MICRAEVFLIESNTENVAIWARVGLCAEVFFYRKTNDFDHDIIDK